MPINLTNSCLAELKIDKSHKTKVNRPLSKLRTNSYIRNSSGVLHIGLKAIDNLITENNDECSVSWL